MKLLMHPAVSALGLSTLCCLVLIAPLVSRAHLAVYHSSGSVTSIFLAVLLDWFSLWLFLTGLLLFAQRYPRAWVATWVGLIFMSPWVLLKEGAKLQAWSFPHWLSIAFFFGSGLCLAVVAIFWRPVFLPAFQRIQHFAATLFGFAGIFAAIVLSQLLWSFWQTRGLNTPIPLRHRLLETAGSLSRPKPRVIWIVLDELSYRQVYERRFTGLNLPAFDLLAKQSTIFTHTVPAGILTENVLPSLITGLPVDHIRSSADGGRLSLHNPVSNQWQPFLQHETIFQDALNAGYSTAVAGWHNPYCRILPQVLDRCYWTMHQLYSEGLNGDVSVAGDAVMPLQRMLESSSELIRSSDRVQPVDRQGAELHIGDYRNLLEAGDQRLEDASTDFLLLHMPVPHPNGIYDRRTGAFATNGGSYIDNLALADQYLGHVYQLLKQRDAWDSSTVLIMGDHSWRTQFWAGSSMWTAEEQTASQGGQFDDRPAYIVKMPEQNQAARIETPFPAICTRTLLQGVLSGRIQSAEDVAEFAKEHQAPCAVG